MATGQLLLLFINKMAGTLAQMSYQPVFIKLYTQLYFMSSWSSLFFSLVSIDSDNNNYYRIVACQ